MTKASLIGVIGVYGKRNLGDEALLEAVKYDFKEVIPGARYIVFCSNPKEVEKLHGDEAVSRKPFNRFFYKISQIRKMQAFVVGGGTLVYEQGSFRKNLSAIIAFYFWPIVAKLFGVATVAYGLGVGPIESRSMKLAASFLPFVFTLITIRDNNSYQYLKDNENCYITCDPVLSSKKYVLDTVPPEFKNEPYMLVSFRFPQSADRGLLTHWVKGVSNFALNSNTNLVILPMQLSEYYAEDELVAEELCSQLQAAGISKKSIRIARWNNVEEGMLWLQNADLVISNRLHALLIAAGANVPVVGIGGNDKILGCLSMLGIEEPIYYLNQNVIHSESITGTLQYAWNAPRLNRELLSQRVNQWRESEPNNIQCLKTLFEKSTG